MAKRKYNAFLEFVFSVTHRSRGSEIHSSRFLIYVGYFIFFFLLCSLTMPWSAVQIQRLAIERQLLDKYFPGRVNWISPLHSTKVEVRMETNNGKKYTLRVYVADDFPNSCPKVVVTSPPRLLQKNGQPLLEASSDFHTLAAVDGFTTICHFYPLHWNAQNTLYQVFMKGRLWLEAYEGHLQTGNTLDVYLPEQVNQLEQLIDFLVISTLARQ